MLTEIVRTSAFRALRDQRRVLPHGELVLGEAVARDQLLVRHAPLQVGHLRQQIGHSAEYT